MSFERGHLIPNAERCEALNREGERCKYRATRTIHGAMLCPKHARAGAVIPDGGWTIPDNLPVFDVAPLLGVRRGSV